MLGELAQQRRDIAAVVAEPRRQTRPRRAAAARRTAAPRTIQPAIIALGHAAVSRRGGWAAQIERAERRGPGAARSGPVRASSSVAAKVAASAERRIHARRATPRAERPPVRAIPAPARRIARGGAAPSSSEWKRRRLDRQHPAVGAPMALAIGGEQLVEAQLIDRPVDRGSPSGASRAGTRRGRAVAAPSAPRRRAASRRAACRRWLSAAASSAPLGPSSSTGGSGSSRRDLR